MMMRSIALLNTILFLITLYSCSSPIYAQQSAVAGDEKTSTCMEQKEEEPKNNVSPGSTPTAKKEDATVDTLQTGQDDKKDDHLNSGSNDNDKSQDSAAQETNGAKSERPIQSGPLVDLFGEQLLSLQMVDETHAQLETHFTNEVLSGKKVIGVYFSADWCGPCRQFTPELVSFYDKMNNRRGKKDQFEIVWVSRCRDVNSFGQYFTHMKWLALPPEEAMGRRGQVLGELFKVKGIPHLVLLDELGNVITYDARNKIPTDRAGIGFPWRNPLAQLYVVLVPKSFRLMIKSHVDGMKVKLFDLLKKK